MQTRPEGGSILVGPRLAYPHGGLLDAIVDGYARTAPDAVAVRHGDATVSYRELSGAAQRAAAALHALGVRAGDVVAVRCATSPAMIATLLGILRCGAAYAAIPLDWPPARREQLFAKAGVRLCVSTDALEPTGGAVRVVTPPELDRPGAGGPPPRRAATGADPCCVFLTSGSTGEPKAILAPHQGIVRVVTGAMFDLGGAPVVMTQFAPTGWDAFALELWAPLLTGGTAVVHDGPEVTGAGIRRAVAAGVNAMFLTASLLHALLEDDPDCIAGLRLLMTGGERVSAAHLLACRRRFPELRLISAYGPAEATIYTTAYPVDGAPLDETPIGTPVANTTVYVLDEAHRVVPAGTVGELAVGGDGLALRYLADPAETARRFRLIDVPGASVRVYLTGDLARLDDAGILWFHGRRDRQIKLRGVRIEPDELERVLEERPDIAHARVLGLPLGGPRTERLVAFYTGPGPLPAPATVLAQLAAALPAGFRPDRAVPLTRMPRLANGKTDNHALAALVPRPHAGRAAPPGVSAAMWRLTGALPHAHDAVLPMLFRLRGGLDPRAVRAALDLVVARHEALRHRCCGRDGRLAVTLAPPAHAAGVLMLDVVTAPRPPAEVLDEARSWLRQPAGLAGTLPVRARLIPADTGEHVLALAVHRAVADDESAAVIARDLGHAYDAVLGGRPAPDPPPADATARGPAAPGRDAEDGGCPPPDGLGPVAELELPLTGEAAQRVHRAARAAGVPAAAVYLAAYARCLQPGRRTVAVPARATRHAGRVGAFETVRAVTLAVGAPGADLVAEAAEALTAEPAGEPPQVTPFARFLWGHGPLEVASRRLKAQPVRVPPANSAWPLTLELDGDDAGGRLRYRTDLLTPGEARRVATQWAGAAATLAGLLRDR